MERSRGACHTPNESVGYSCKVRLREPSRVILAPRLPTAYERSFQNSPSSSNYW